MTVKNCQVLFRRSIACDNEHCSVLCKLTSFWCHRGSESRSMQNVDILTTDTKVFKQTSLSKIENFYIVRTNVHICLGKG